MGSQNLRSSSYNDLEAIDAHESTGATSGLAIGHKIAARDQVLASRVSRSGEGVVVTGVQLE
ncbi:hypothetical protein L917_01443 [Phytophthora nicotianae]|uniref:Uncharacterized protein n=1 Tax=Phytophthora nicotianae TaxID=4792 RepID=W2LWX4_PHYNI|nr:hypothetical protein L917_01443 [Phytophthora nicotianae]